MSSVSITTAKAVYGGNDEAETLRNIAATYPSSRIYKYANDFGDRKTHTDYKIVRTDAEENALLSSPHTHNCVLVYDGGKIV